LFAGWEIVINDVEDLAFDPLFYPCKGDSIGTIVYIGEWNAIAAAHMEKNPEGIDPYPAGDGSLAWPEDNTGSQNDIGNPMSPGVVHDQLILLDFPVTIGLMSQLRLALNLASLIEQITTPHLHVGVDGKGANAYKPLQLPTSESSIEKIPGCDYGVHKSAGERLFNACGEVIDH